jgi:Cation efflux family
MKEASDLRGIVFAVVAYVMVFALKLAAYFVTGVMVLLAEALHTLSDIFISGFLLIGLLWSRRKADKMHMFGYGRAQNVAALVAATLFISFTSYKLFGVHPAPVSTGGTGIQLSLAGADGDPRLHGHCGGTAGGTTAAKTAGGPRPERSSWNL